MFLDLASGLSIMQTGKVRVLVFGGRARSPLLPGVPTLIEEGVTDAEVFAFQGLLGPAGMPVAAVKKLNAELGKAHATASFSVSLGVAHVDIGRVAQFWLAPTLRHALWAAYGLQVQQAWRACALSTQQ